jgi:hypothetical protein
VLRTVAGDALPAVLVTNEFYETRVFSDTIRLRADQTGTQTSVHEAIPLAPGIPAEGLLVYSASFQYEIGGKNRIEIGFDCPPNANCIAPPHLVGTVTADRLRVSWTPQLVGRDPLEYARIAGP